MDAISGIIHNLVYENLFKFKTSSTGIRCELVYIYLYACLVKTCLARVSKLNILLIPVSLE